FESSPVAEITVRELLRHNSGITFAIQALKSTPAAQWNERIAAAPLGHAIGERVHYSCTNYYLLARVVEVVCGQPLQRFIEERIIEPLGLENTTFEPLQKYSIDRIAPTVINAATGKPHHGIVHYKAARPWRA